MKGLRAENLEEAGVSNSICFIAEKKNSDWSSKSIPLNPPKALLRLRSKVTVAWPMVQKHEVGALIARPESFEPVLSG